MELHIRFLRHPDVHLDDVLSLCRERFSFRALSGPDGVEQVSVTFDQDSLDAFDRVADAVAALPGTRFAINGQAVDLDRLRRFLDCYRCRCRALDRAAYCRGGGGSAGSGSRQLFPCRLIPVSDDNADGWFRFGRLARDGTFVVDKQALRRHVYAALQESLAIHCPALFPAEVDAVIEGLPSRIDPRRDARWTYRHGWEAGRVQAVGVERRAGEAGAAAGDGVAARPVAAGAGTGRRAAPAAGGEGRQVPQVRYDDIGGLHPQIRRLRETVELPLRRPEVFQRLGITPHRGVLLCGPPGTGKTLLAKALASECNAHFILVNGPELLSKWYGESEANLRRLFAEARDKQPSVVVFDEVDALAPARDRVSHSFEAVFVSQLLALLDGLEERGQVVVIGTTNRPEAVDPALRRPGRLDLTVEVGLPDLQGRREILRIHTRAMPLDGDVDLEALAAATEGWSGAELAGLCREAAMCCLREHLDWSAEDAGLSGEAVASLRVGQRHLQAAWSALAQARARSGAGTPPRLRGRRAPRG